jgi:hypothetical protein
MPPPASLWTTGSGAFSSQVPLTEEVFEVSVVSAFQLALEVEIGVTVVDRSVDRCLVRAAVVSIVLVVVIDCS